MLCSAICSAKELTPNEAIQRFKSNTSKLTRSGSDKQLTLCHTSTTSEGKAAIYIFNQEDGGFVVLSANDIAAPLLGYAEQGVCDPARLPEPFKWWLKQYCAQIQFAEAMKAPSYKSATPTRSGYPAAIRPMVTTKWNQGAPYNLMCPITSQGQCVTGCVATALAQTMKYWNYPEIGKDTIEYSAGSLGKKLSMNFAAQKFDWNNMLNVYDSNGTPNYSETEANAVAYLMKACGYGVQMNYTAIESGAISYNMGTALINYFGYNPNMSYEERDYYSNSQWDAMVYGELQAGRPVLYGGRSAGGGHQFVCDGYNEGYYHINWGWGGLSDGYFMLQSLNPSDIGIGGGTGGGYSFDQSIMRGVQPSETGERNYAMTQYGSVNAKVDGDNVVVQWGNGDTSTGIFNMTYYPIVGELGLKLQKENATESFLPLDTIELATMRGWRKLTFKDLKKLDAGQYTVTPVVRMMINSVDTCVAMKCPIGSANSFNITVAASGLSVENQKVKAATITAAKFLTPLYNDSPVKFQLSISNQTEIELSQQVAPVLTQNGKVYFQGESLSIYLNPGESATKEWMTNFSLADGQKMIEEPTDFKLQAINLLTGEIYPFSQDVTMLYNMGKWILTYSNMKVENSTTTKISLDDNSETEAFIVTDKSNIPVNVTIKNSGSRFFAQKCYVLIFNADLKGYNIGTGVLSPLPMLDMKQSETLSCNIDFSAGNIGSNYAMIVFYDQGAEGLKQMSGPFTYFTIQKTSAIKDINKDGKFAINYDNTKRIISANKDCQLIEIYDIAGRKLAEFSNISEITLPELNTGVIIIKAHSREEIATLKVLN